MAFYLYIMTVICSVYSLVTSNVAALAVGLLFALLATIIERKGY